MTQAVRMTVPTAIGDEVNARILAVAEDRVAGFLPEPLGEIARLSGVEVETVTERIVAMVRAGTIRRVRQTLLATNLAHGALVAWRVPAEKLNAAFDYLFQEDPFSGHVVIRSTDGATTGHQYRLWTTLKVPERFSLQKHCEFLGGKIGAEKFLILPAKRLFVLGVGHVRRRGLKPGAKAEELAEVIVPEIVRLSELEWRVLTALKREFTAEELEAAADRSVRSPQSSALNAQDSGLRTQDSGLDAHGFWSGRAAEAGTDLETFHRVGASLNERGVIGRFSTFLEHVKTLVSGEQVTRYNALFHWAVPAGREIEAGREIGRFHIMTHAYWREGGPEFGNVNLMGVAHGTDKGVLLAHKVAMDAHLAAPKEAGGAGIPVTYTNVFWGGRSEIKPSEISPLAYEGFCRANGVEPQEMRM